MDVAVKRTNAARIIVSVGFKVSHADRNVDVIIVQIRIQAENIDHS